MSVKIMAEVWASDLPREEKYVLLAYGDHADDEGVCFPSKARVAWKTGYDQRQITRISKKLLKRGALVIEDHGKGGRGLATVYRVVPAAVPKLPAFKKKGDKTVQENTGKMSPFPNEAPPDLAGHATFVAETMTSESTKPDKINESMTSQAKKDDAAMSPQSPSFNHHKESSRNVTDRGTLAPNGRHDLSPPLDLQPPVAEPGSKNKDRTARFGARTGEGPESQAEAAAEKNSKRELREMLGDWKKILGGKNQQKPNARREPEKERAVKARGLGLSAKAAKPPGRHRSGRRVRRAGQDRSVLER